MSELRDIRKNIGKKNGYFSAIYFLFAGIIASAFVFLNLLIGTSILTLFIIPFIIIPTYFAFSYLTLNQDNFNNLTFKVFFSGFKAYFSEKFSSTFGVIRTLLFLILVNLVASLVSGIAITLPFYNYNILGIRDIFTTLQELISNGTTVEALNEFINLHKTAINTFMIYVEALPATITVMLGLYWMHRNSISLFERNSNKFNGRFNTIIYRQFVKKYRFNLFKVDMYYNWYVYLLTLVMFGVGGYIGSLYLLDYSCVFTFALAFGLFTYVGVLGLIGHNNKEATYQYFKKEIASTFEEFEKDFLLSIQEAMRFNQKDINSEVDIDREETKKDSDESS